MKRFEKAPRILLCLVMLWSVVFLVTFSDAGVPFPTWMVMAGAFVSLTVAWIIRLAIAFGADKISDQRRMRQHLGYWISIPAILLASILLAGRPTLLKARVYLSAGALVHDAAVDEENDRWIGLFHVREFSRIDNELRFLTNECGLVDTCGIVYSPGTPPQNRGEDSFTHLYGPWWHWHQSW